MKKINALFAFLVCQSGSVLSSPVPADLDALFDLPLDQLQKIQVHVPAAMTQLSPLDTPASITSISAHDIKLTPHRNILDLIETYVPGAIWMNHEDGPHPGVRGLIVNRNYQYLLLLNGRNLNNKGYFSAKSELEMWDLADIKNINIIRGAGSVVYGPGAVAGIIDIQTYNAKDQVDTSITVNQNQTYSSTGISAQGRMSIANTPVFAHVSIRQSDGHSPDQFLVTGDNEAGFIGQDIETDTMPLDYMADYSDTPQIKLYLDSQLNAQWRAWLRYTQQGSYWSGNEAQTALPSGELLNLQGTQDRQFTLTFEHNSKLNEHLQSQAIISVDSYDSRRSTSELRSDIGFHPLNMKVDFAEHELLIKEQLTWQVQDNLQLAIGLEFSHDEFGPGWDDSKDKMRLGEGGVIVSSPDSQAIEAGNKGSADRKGTEIYVDNGWHTQTYSLFTEANYKFNEAHRLLASVRSDKNTYSNWLFSPRLAYIWNINSQHNLRVIAQRSLRMNTAGQLYHEDQNDQSPTSEKLTSFEFIHGYYFNEKSFSELSLYRNNIEILGWEGDLNVTQPLGTLDLVGLDWSLNYQWQQATIGISAAWLKMLNWQLNSGLTSSGISYSDYKTEMDLELSTDSVTQLGYGEHLNNWPSHCIKAFVHYPINQSLWLHSNIQYFSEFEGAKDGLAGLQQAVAGSSDAALVDQSISVAEQEDVYEYQLGLNFSLIYTSSNNWQASLKLQNLLTANGIRRYSYDSGNDDPAPRKIRFIDEPSAIEASVKYVF